MTDKEFSHTLMLDVIKQNSIDQLEFLLEYQKMVQMLIVTIPIFLLILAKLYIDKAYNYVLEVLVKLALSLSDQMAIESDEDKDREILVRPIDQRYESFTKQELEKDIEFEDYIQQDKEVILLIVEQRIILEKLLKDIHYLVFKEHSKLSFSRIESLLSRENILDSNMTFHLKRVYAICSYVIHEAKLPAEIKTYDEVIAIAKEMIHYLNYVRKRETTNGKSEKVLTSKNTK